MAILMIQPSRSSRIGWSVAFGAMSVLFLLGAVFVGAAPRKPLNSDFITAHLVPFSCVLAVFFAGSALEWPQRQVVISENVLREWRWFHWREVAIPARVLVGSSRKGRVAIGDAVSRKTLFVFVREFGSQRELQERLESFFAGEDRLERA